MRRLYVLIVLLLLSVPCQYASASDGDGVLLTAVITAGSSEGVAITNFTGVTVDLSAYSLSDGEGSVTFDSIDLPSHSTIYVLSDEPEDWMCIGDCIIDGQGAHFNRFALNDNGDDIRLICGERTIDAFCYGNVISDIGWNGDPYPRIAKKHMAVRCSVFDTDSLNDWKTIVPGRSDRDVVTEGFEAMVSPFKFPESNGHQVLDVLYSAEAEVDISVYMLTHRDIVSILNSLLAKGIEVNILVEGSPVGGMSQSEKDALSVLKGNGADVRAITSSDGYRRYTYLHNKYAVVDGHTTVITSENWTESSFDSNIGWGVILESQEVADYYRDVFMDDFGGESDISVWESVGTDASYDRGYVPTERNHDWYSARVYPVLSPDNSWGQMRSLISSAQSRLYTEQLDVSFDWSSGGDNPLQWFLSSDAERMMILDASYDSPDDEKAKDSYSLMTSLDGSGIGIRLSEDVTVHNKGLIADDRVWIGSVNWTDNSFRNNREAAVIIDSSEVAEVYASYFMTDWEPLRDHDPELVVSYPEFIKGDRAFIMEIESMIPDGSTVRWAIDEDIIREGNRIAVRLPEGEHSVTVTVEGTDLTYSMVLEVSGGDPFSDIPYGYYVAASILLCLLLVKVAKAVRRRSDDKGVRSRGFR